jgi:uncharacterized NAD(P)/FAD-binding protein YdhS
MRIGVVGVGAAGVALLTHLSAAAARTWAGSEIWLFDEPANLGRGMAFGEALDAARINTRPDRLDLGSADRLTFAQWSGSRGADVFDLDNDPVPRHVFGEYLAEHVALAVNRLRRQGVRVNVVPERVKRIEAGSRGALRVRAAGVTTVLDRVVVAVGTWPKPVAPELERHPDFVGRMYPLTDTVRRNANCGSIGVLGMGLAAIDGVLALAEHCPQARIVMASRSGALPWVQAAPVGRGLGTAHLRHLTVDNIDRLHRTRRLRAESLLDLLRADLAEFGQDLDEVLSGHAWEAHWRDPVANVDDLRCHHALTRSNAALNHAWALLPARERPGIRAVLGARWMRYRVRMPLGTWRQLRELIATGRVVRLDRFVGVRADDGGIAMLTTDSTVRVDRLVNGTGHGAHLRTAGAPLAGLVRAGAIGVDEDGRGLVDETSCRALRADGTVHPGLILLGAGTSGTFFLTSALDVVVDQAVRASEYLARDLSGRAMAA